MSLLSFLLEDLLAERETLGRDDSIQGSFNPIDYDFRWTKDWYEWDSKSAHQAAVADRDKRAADLKKKGYKVQKGTSRGQLVRRGGIGSGHPEIDEIVTVYTFHARKG